jgi:hypothetical protein
MDAGHWVAAYAAPVSTVAAGIEYLPSLLGPWKTQCQVPLAGGGYDHRPEVCSAALLVVENSPRYRFTHFKLVVHLLNFRVLFFKTRSEIFFLLR